MLQKISSHDDDKHVEDGDRNIEQGERVDNEDGGRDCTGSERQNWRADNRRKLRSLLHQPSPALRVLANARRAKPAKPTPCTLREPIGRCTGKSLQLLISSG